MAEYILDIGDETGRSFRLAINTSGGRATPDNRFAYFSWRTIDKGFIRFNSGESILDKHTGELMLQNTISGERGSRLEPGTTLISIFEWQKFSDWRPCGSGIGRIDPKAVLAITSGTVNWVNTSRW